MSPGWPSLTISEHSQTAPQGSEYLAPQYRVAIALGDRRLLQAIDAGRYGQSIANGPGEEVGIGLVGLPQRFSIPV